jgi:uncharacterized phage protein (TIGR02218 family)
VFTSGQNVGARRTVKSSYASGLTIALPLPNPVSPGDVFQVSAGCDKTHTTCKNKFDNINRFRGFPWIPKPETAL